MKNVKKQDKTLFALCIGVVFMLIVTAVMSFAYFTARAESETQAIQFGVLELDVIDGFELKNEENQNVKIVPGCTIKMAGTIKLTETSNVDAFVRVKPTVTVEKDGKTATDVSADTFVELFNSALFSGNGSWKTPETTDGYIYFAGKFSNSNTGTNIVKSFDLSNASFELDATKFGNVWQGVTVSIGLTVQALQSAHVGVDNVADTTTYPNAQSLVNAIANIEAWEDEFGEAEALKAIYDETWTYTRGEFSQTKTANAQMASYGTFTESSSGEYIQFGWYPQTIKANEVTITTTTKKFAGWDCYVGSDSCLYVKVASPTPYGVNGTTYSNGMACSTKTELYFKLERIVWQILSDTNGNRLLCSVKELTSMVYFERASSGATRTIQGESSGIYDNNYKYSYVRAYLNGLDTYGTSGTVNANTSKYYYKDKGLLQQAFTTDQLKLINETTVNNAKETTSTDSDGNNKYTCENTTDKIFLLSYQDLKSTYSSAMKNGSSSATEMKFPTDYAGAMGAERYYASDELWASYYWLRSPYSSSSSFAWCVDVVGTMCGGGVNFFSFGVVPALFLNI